MNSFITIAGVVLIGLMLLVLVRVIKGPTVIDRLVAVNVIGTKSIVLLLFSGIIFGQLEMFVDIALGYGLLNFCLLYTSPSPRDGLLSRMPSSA